MCETSLLVEPANRKAAAVSLSVGRDPGSLGWDPAAGQEESPGPELLETVVICNILSQNPVLLPAHRCTVPLCIP